MSGTDEELVHVNLFEKTVGAILQRFFLFGPGFFEFMDYHKHRAGNLD